MVKEKRENSKPESELVKTMPKLTPEEINGIANLYLGRNATEQELNRFKNAKTEDEKMVKNYFSKLAKEEEKTESIQNDLGRKEARIQGEQAMKTQYVPQETANTVTSQPIQPGIGAPSRKTIGPESSYMFDGNLILVRFIDDPTPTDPIEDAGTTIWLFNKKEKVYRPFNSITALESYTGRGRDEVAPLINDVSSTVLSNLEWEGKFVARKDAIQDNGTFNKDPEFVYETPTMRPPEGTAYGKQIDPQINQDTGNFLGNILDKIIDQPGAQGEDPWLKRQITEKYLSDPKLLARYIKALGYGGYAAKDILADLRAKQLAEESGQSSE